MTVPEWVGFDRVSKLGEYRVGGRSRLRDGRGQKLAREIVRNRSEDRAAVDAAQMIGDEVNDFVSDAPDFVAGPRMLQDPFTPAQGPPR